MTPNYYNFAVAEIGQREIEGSASNPRILQYQTAAGYNAKQDDVAWCGSFVSWCMKQAGVKYNSSTAAQAASWAKWGKAVKIPTVGTVMVFPHHVGFFAGWVSTVGGAWRLLSGNSGGASAGGGEVRISTYSNMSQVIGMRIPADMPTPAVVKNVVNSPVVKGTVVSGGAIVTAVVSNQDTILDNLEKAQSHFSSGTFITIVACIVAAVTVGYIVYQSIHSNMLAKKFATPPKDESPA